MLIGVFVGYSEDIKACRILDLTLSIIESRDVEFTKIKHLDDSKLVLSFIPISKDDLEIVHDLDSPLNLRTK